MKRNFNIKTTLLLALTIASFGCKKITDINVSPNNPSIDKATTQVLFPSGVLSTAGEIGGELDIIGGIWSQYWTQSVAASQFKTIDSYNLQRQDFNGGYNGLMAGALADYQLAITKAKANGQNQFLLMNTVMKAYTYEVLVDLYDQVPYTEAFQGAANLQPKFDDGFFIYKSLLAEIDAALATNYDVPLSEADSKIDILFGGDGTYVPENEMESWRRFANTLKLKMYLRMVNTHAADAQAGISALFATNPEFLDETTGYNINKVPSGLGAGVNVFTDATDQRNPLQEYTVFNLGGNDLRASNTLVSWLTEHGDPRIVNYFGTASPTPIDQGFYTATQSAHPSYYSATAPSLSPTDPVFFITTAEAYFLRAEAALRYNVGGNTSTLFDNGVKAAFHQYGLTVPTDTVYTYREKPTLNGNLRQIIYQKWASFPSSHCLEGFFDQERTGFPENSAIYSTDAGYIPGQWVFSKNGVTGGRFPKRLVFPDSERSRNKNTPAEVAITQPVWWGLPNK